MTEYPEHEKLKRVNTLSQTIGEFLEWASEQGMMLCERTGSMDYYVDLQPVRRTKNEILAEYFKIDLNVFEDEKVEMLKEQRDLNAKLVTEKLTDQYLDTIEDLGKE